MQRTTMTALAFILASGAAFADNHTGASDTASMSMDSADLIRTRDMTGGPVFSLDAVNGAEEWTDDVYSAVDDGWTQIGEIEDVVLNRDGEVMGFVAELGGFLDLGDKHVLIEVADAKFVPVDDRSYAIVTRHSEERLEELEGIDEGFWN